VRNRGGRASDGVVVFNLWQFVGKQTAKQRFIAFRGPILICRKLDETGRKPGQLLGPSLGFLFYVIFTFLLQAACLRMI